ncbi:hypothetical protein PTTG_06510 [Puccinia triticina 1-1 BBBD Race 1]|uniref:MBOAT_2 domain-containing protein n=1 Tax=Puccinia triticina (isolate 1-1 / race 1 (BBBD)) TaxID=630390 RepID=A0A180GI73_PUCT1|nr:hypothetical protein PTTG_06510 [Puccinia triticina 1-1 BBBD Race 1]
MATSWTDNDLFATNEFRRMLPGYLFLVPLLTQTFLMNPCYEKSPNAKLARLALMPITIYLTLTRVSLRLFYPLNVFFHWNFSSVSFPTFHAVCLAIQYGLFQGPVFASKEEMIKAGNYRGDPDDEKSGKNKPDFQPNMNPSFLERVKFTIWILFSPRGLETSWAPSLEVVPRGPKMGIGLFFFYILAKTIVCHIMMTTLWMIGVECAQHPNGAYGFLADWMPWLPHLQVLKKYPQLDYLSPAPFGGAAWFAIDTLGGILTLLEVILYLVGPYILPKDLAPGKFDSTLYPPLFNDLHMRESLIAFWSRGWHAIFRRNIIFCGWNPMEYLFSGFGKDTAKTAGMMGGMIFSGIFHEYLIAAVSEIDWKFPTVLMFTLCGAGMVAEVQFKRRTGRLVKGLLGRWWLVLVIGAYGKHMVESWMARGLGRSDMPPPRLWTWPRFLVPFSGLLPERWIARIAALAP